MKTDIPTNQRGQKMEAGIGCTSRREGWRCCHSFVKPPASFDFPVKQDIPAKMSSESPDASPLKRKE